MVVLRPLISALVRTTFLGIRQAQLEEQQASLLLPVIQ